MLRSSLRLVPLLSTVFLSCAGSSLNVPPIDPGEKPEAAIAALEAGLAKAAVEQVDLLSPKWFKRARESLGSAQRLLDRKSPPAPILEAVAAGKAELRKATETASLCRATIPEALKARDDAIAAGASSLKKNFRNAEEAFQDLARAIEGNDVMWAKKREGAVIERYRALETTAIRESTLGEARALIATARKEGAALSLPKTLSEAEKRLKEADALVVKTPEDKSKLVTRAKEALFEAKRLAALNKVVVAQQGKTLEDTLLWAEDLLSRAAASLTAVDVRDREFAARVDAIRAAANAIRTEQEASGAKTRTQEEEIRALREKLAKLENPSPPKK